MPSRWPAGERSRRSPRERGVGEGDADGHDQQREEEHDGAGAALDEGDLPGPDDVHDEGLGEDGFHEPSRVEQGLVVGLHVRAGRRRR